MSDGYWSRATGRTLRRRGFIGALGVGGLGAAALAAGCGGSNNNKTSSQATATKAAGAGAAPAGATSVASSATSAASRATAAVGAPVPAAGTGGSMRGHDNGDPASLDYIKTWSQRSLMYTAMVYPRLLKFDTSKPTIQPIDFLITNDLATKMPEQPDSTTYIFKLNAMKWENKAPLNGRALTADDVVKNWDRFKTEHPSRSLLSDVAKVEAVDPSTVKFTLSKPLGPFVNHIGHQGVFYIQPPELFGTGKLEKDMWSGGPWTFKGYDVGSKLTFERNPEYWLKDRPVLKEYIYQLIPDTSTTISALRSKPIDTLTWTAVVTPNDVASLKKDLPDATFLPYSSQGNGWFGMDLKDPKFQDKRVRQAISMTLNRDDLVKVGQEGQWALPWGVLSQFYPDPKKNEFPNAKYYQNNPKDAKALFDASGVKPDANYDLIASAVWTPTQLQQAQLMQEQIKTLGFNTTIKVKEFAEFYALTTVAGTWSGGFANSANLVGADPNEYLSIFWQPDSPRLISPGLKDILAQDKELLDLIEGQKRELDVTKRKGILKDVANVMADRMYNIPTVVGVFYHTHRSNVKNMNWIFTYAQGGEYLLDSYVQGA